MGVHNHGNEDTSDLKIQLGEDETMTKIEDLMNEVEVYKQAIQDAKDALASAEMELDAALETEFEGQ